MVGREDCAKGGSGGFIAGLRTLCTVREQGALMLVDEKEKGHGCEGAFVCRLLGMVVSLACAGTVMLGWIVGGASSLMVSRHLEESHRNAEPLESGRNKFAEQNRTLLDGAQRDKRGLRQS